jgi:hypothetical protein
MSGSSTQLEVAHVDAHGDFSGQIDRGVFGYLEQKLLSHPVSDRLAEIEKHRSKLTLANYMSFAVACQWISKVVFVTHPDWRPNIDPFPYFFRNKDPAT